MNMKISILRYLTGVAAVVIALAMYYLLPFELYSYYYGKTFVLGGLLLGVLLFFTFTNLTGWNNKTFMAKLLTLVVPVVLSWFYMTYLAGIYQTKEMQKCGIITSGLIVNADKDVSIHASRYSVRKAESSFVMVEYFTQKQEKRIAKIDVTDQEFERLSISSKVNLIYSPINPEHVELFLYPENTDKYLNKTIPDVNITDLIALMKGDYLQQKQYLDKYNYGWTYNSKDSVWSNFLKDRVLKVVNPDYGQLQFYSTNTFLNTIEQSGFQKKEGQNEFMPFYESKDYIVNSVNYLNCQMVTISKK